MRSCNMFQVDTTRLQKCFFFYIKSKVCCFKLKSVTSSRNCRIYNRVITRNEVIFKYIDMSMQDIVCHDHVIINPAEIETLQFKVFESLYVTMIGIALTAVIAPACKESLHIL